MANTKETRLSDEMENIQELSVGAFVDMMTESYLSCIRNGIPVGKEGAPVFLWGPTGIGKSDAIKEIAKRLEKEAQKEVRVVDVRLSTQSPMDIKGLLLPSEDRKSSVYTPLSTYQFEEREDLINILFFDELTSAPQAIQAAAYEIIRDRKIDQNYFPDNVIMIGAGNRISDKGLTYRMLKPLANRFEHYRITTSFAVWEKWATANEIHPLVIRYLKSFPHKLTKETVEDQDLAFPTPRSWENVSKKLYQLYEPDNQYTLTLKRRIAGTIGVSEERAFHHWVSLGREMPSLEIIAAGKCTIAPKTKDVVYALIESFLRYLEDEYVKKAKTMEKDLISVSKLANICRYAEAYFPSDFQKIFFEQLFAMEEMRGFLMRIPDVYKRMNRK